MKPHMKQHTQRIAPSRAAAYRPGRGRGAAGMGEPRRRRKAGWLALLAALLAVGAVVAAIGAWDGALVPLLGNPSRAAGKAAAVPSPALPPPGMPVPSKTFHTRLFTDAVGRSMTYYLYGPDGFEQSRKYPLVVLLHGGGERVDPTLTPAQNRDVLLRQQYVKAFVSPEAQREWPSFVVAPQATASERWVGTPAVGVSAYTLPPQPTDALTLAMEIVRSLRQTYPQIDGNRIYIGGISMGGFGTWEAAERWPDVFAAAFPIAGAGDPKAAGALAHLSIWAFHGGGDILVPVQGSRLMVQAVRAAGGAPCYTEYPGANHDVWFTKRPLNDPRVLAWIFAQTKALLPDVTPPSCPTLT